MNEYLRKPAHPWSEFEVQACAYAVLVKWLGPHRVRGEVSKRVVTVRPVSRGVKGREQMVRFDIVIYDPDLVTPRLVIEVKRDHACDRKRREWQRASYPIAAGVPCIFISGMAEAAMAEGFVRKALAGSNGAHSPSASPTLTPEREGLK